MATVLIASFGWVIFASVYLLFKDQIIESKNRQIVNMEAAYEQLALELSDTQDHFDSLTSDLEAKHNQLSDLVHYKRSLEERLGELTDKLDTITSERNQALTIKRSLKAQVEHWKPIWMRPHLATPACPIRLERRGCR